MDDLICNIFRNISRKINVYLMYQFRSIKQMKGGLCLLHSTLLFFLSLSFILSHSSFLSSLKENRVKPQTIQQFIRRHGAAAPVKTAQEERKLGKFKVAGWRLPITQDSSDTTTPTGDSPARLKSLTRDKFRNGSCVVENRAAAGGFYDQKPLTGQQNRVESL